MTIEQKIIAGLSAVILAGVTFAGIQMVKAHDANLVAATQQKSDDALKAVADKAIADRDALQQSFAKQIAAQQASVKTSTQAVQIIEHYVPAPAAAQPVVIQKEQLTKDEQAKLPDAPSYVITTEQQSIDTAKAFLQCDVTTKALTVCRADLNDTQNNVAITEADAATWEKAAKGGSRWARLWTATKYGLIGAGIGVGVGYMAHR